MMNKAIKLIYVAIALASVPSPAFGDGKLIVVKGNPNPRDFMSSLKKSKKNVIIDITAKWCGACRLAAPHVSAAAETKSDKIDVISVDSDENPDLATALMGLIGARGIPTFLFFTKEGEKGLNLVGGGTGFTDGGTFEDDIAAAFNGQGVLAAETRRFADATQLSLSAGGVQVGQAAKAGAASSTVQTPSRLGTSIALGWQGRQARTGYYGQARIAGEITFNNDMKSSATAAGSLFGGRQLVGKRNFDGSSNPHFGLEPANMMFNASSDRDQRTYFNYLPSLSLGYQWSGEKEKNDYPKGLILAAQGGASIGGLSQGNGIAPQAGARLSYFCPFGSLNLTAFQVFDKGRDASVISSDAVLKLVPPALGLGVHVEHVRYPDNGGPIRSDTRGTATITVTTK